MAKNIKTFRFNYTGKVQEIEIPVLVKQISIEAYGCATSANGGYAYGTYTFRDNNRKLYIYCGGINWNGGGPGNSGYGSPGGGASDVRLVKASDNTWYDTSHSSWGTDASLLSRIIVAGGAGGAGIWNNTVGGIGGGLEGGKGPGAAGGAGGTQSSGGANGGSWGYPVGGDGTFGTANLSSAGAGGGGGGWYGGGSGSCKYCDDGSGGGGSSYIDLLDAEDRGTKAGINTSTGYVIISYEQPDRIAINNFEYTGKIVNYTIPHNGIYEIECWGASGGGPNRDLCGLGAYSKSIARLKKGDILKILVAGKGEWDGSRGGGGGSSFIELQPSISVTTATLLCAAGGGGGSIFSRQPNKFSHGQSGKYAGNYNLTGFLTGLGTAGRSDLASGTGGAGYIYNSLWSWNDVPSFCDPLIVGATSFKNGGSGGYGTGGRNNGGYYENMIATPKGGFGGGGSSSYFHPIGNAGGVIGYYRNGAGGGGGYSGGDSTRDGYANTAGGGSSYFASFEIPTESFAKAGYEEMPQTDGSTNIGNLGNGYVRITSSTTGLYFLILNGKKYVPVYDYFITEDSKFKEISDEELIKIYSNESEYYTYYNIDDAFTKDGKTIKPSDYIDFKKCKIGVITSSTCKTDHITFMPYETNLSKSNIKLKEQIRGMIYEDFIDIESPDKNYSEYITSYNNKYKNCSILNTEILKNFSYFAFRFNDPKGKISKIQMDRYDNLKLTKIEKRYFECKSDLLTTSITFNKNYNKVLINKLTKQKFKYSTDRLETF